MIPYNNLNSTLFVKATLNFIIFFFTSDCSFGRFQAHLCKLLNKIFFADLLINFKSNISLSIIFLSHFRQFFGQFKTYRHPYLSPKNTFNKKNGFPFQDNVSEMSQTLIILFYLIYGILIYIAKTKIGGRHFPGLLSG